MSDDPDDDEAEPGATRDPFDDFDVPDDREGDPFESLEEAGGDVERDRGPFGPPGGRHGQRSSESTEGDSPDARDPAGAWPGSVLGGSDSEGPTTGPGPGDTPTTDAATDASGPGTPDGIDGPDVRTDPDDPFGDVDPGGDPFQGEGNVFERVSVGSIDEDGIWQSLTDAGDERAPEGPRYVEVSKHRYCQQCPHFSPPPDVQCTHDGTDILEFVDMDTVRVRNCPIVAERESLEQFE